MLSKRLSDHYQRELQNVRDCADSILSQPLDWRFTDHTIKHKERIIEHLNKLLPEWAERELKKDKKRAEAEIFVLIAAAYLHDIGMQTTKFENCPSIIDNLVKLGMDPPDYIGNRSITDDRLDFARKYHHVITYDWLTKVNLPGGQNIFPGTGLQSHIEAVARVARAHNIWLTNNNSYQKYESLVENMQAQEGEIRVKLLAAFLRLGDISDMDSRRVDMDKLKRFNIPSISKVHWWRHHFTTTCRFENLNTEDGSCLKLSFTLPKAHDGDRDWLVNALYTSVVKEIEAEQQRLSKYIGGTGVWIKFPELEECEVLNDVSGEIDPMPDDIKLEFQRIWPAAKSELAQIEVSDALAQGALTSTMLSDALPSMEIGAQINEYLTALKEQQNTGFRDTPYVPIELDYDEGKNALDALSQLLVKPRPVPRPIVIVGDPGAGKTTFVRRYILDCAKAERSTQYLPIYIMANRYGGDDHWVQHMHDRLGKPNNPISEQADQNIGFELSDHLLLLMAQTVCDLAAIQYEHVQEVKANMREIMARRPCLIVFDGLNEATPLRRDLAIKAIRAFTEEYSAHQVLVTSRVGDYHEDFFPNAPMQTVLPLRPDIIKQYWQVKGISVSTTQKVLNQDVMLELASNPMYMYMMGELMKNNELEHFQHPGKLFHQFNHKLLQRWHKRQNGNTCLTPDDMHAVMAQIAFRALQNQQVVFSESTIATALEQWFAALALAHSAEIQAKTNRSHETVDSNQQVLIDMYNEVLDAGLIIRVGSSSPANYRFRHHTTQDYFAAAFIANHTDLLPVLISQAVFHEPIRLVVSIIEDPNGFVQQLTNSTTEEIGRNRMLRLCFRVAGAMPERLSQATLTDLFAAVTPIYYIAITLRLPFGVDVLTHLFSHLSWEDVAKFFAVVVNNQHLPPHAHNHAGSYVTQALNERGKPTEQRLREYFDNDIPIEKWNDYQHCQDILLEEDEHKTGLSMHPLLLGGTAGSPSLTALEKLRIGNALRRITANQMGALEMIFVDEIATFGGFSLVGGWHHDVIKLYDTNIIGLLLNKADGLLNSGDIDEGIGEYFNSLNTTGQTHGLLQRLVYVSEHMSDAQITELVTLIQNFAVSGVMFVDRSSSTVVGRLSKNPSIHPKIVGALESRLTEQENIHLVLLFYHLLPYNSDRQQSVSRIVDGLLQPTDCESMDGLLLLEAMTYSVVTHDLHEKIIERLDRYHPQRPSQRLAEWLDCLLNLPKNHLNQAYLEGFQSFGFQQTLICDSAAKIIQQLNSDEWLSLVESISEKDKTLGVAIKLQTLEHFANDDALDKVMLYMNAWGLTIEYLAGDLNSSEKPKATLLFLAKNGHSDDILTQLGWENGVVKAVGMFTYKEDYELIITLLEQQAQFYDAYSVSCQLLALAAEGKCDDAQGIAQTTQRLAEPAFEDEDGTSAVAFMTPLVTPLLQLLNHPLEYRWAFELLQRLYKKGYVPSELYVSACQELLKVRQPFVNVNVRRNIMAMLSKIGRHDSVLDLMEKHLRYCPADPELAAGYCGNAGWYSYLAGDDQQFLLLTEKALEFTVTIDYQNDWLLANRAFAYFILGREAEAIRGYEQTRACVENIERWGACVMEDLRKHSERRPEATPINEAFIAKVSKLSDGLPVSKDVTS